jgi:hypothetical protein
MTDIFSIEIEMPEFMGLMDSEAKKRILEEVKERIRVHVTELVEKTARDIIAQKLDLYPPQPPDETATVVTSDTVTEPAPTPPSPKVKTDLAEEILSLPEDEALRRLKLSLAQGEIDEDTYKELKGLVEPLTSEGTCSQCGKELEPGVNFCRFCGAKIK